VRKPSNGLPVGEQHALIDQLAVGSIPIRQGDCVRVRQVDVYTATGAGQIDHECCCGMWTAWLEYQTTDGMGLYRHSPRPIRGLCGGIRIPGMTNFGGE
jgi:hypothetical protein